LRRVVEVRLLEDERHAEHAFPEVDRRLAVGAGDGDVVHGLALKLPHSVSSCLRPFSVRPALPCTRCAAASPTAPARRASARPPRCAAGRALTPLAPGPPPPLE